MFAAASYVVSDHLEVQRNFCAERVRQVVGGKPITHRAIGPIERRRADELLSLRGCTPPGPGLAPKVRGPVSKTLGSVLAGGVVVVGAHTARTAAQSCVELLSLSRRTHPRLEDHRSADPGGGRQLTTVQAKETDRKIFFARKVQRLS